MFKRSSSNWAGLKIKGKEMLNISGDHGGYYMEA